MDDGRWTYGEYNHLCPTRGVQPAREHTIAAGSRSRSACSANTAAGVATASAEGEWQGRAACTSATGQGRTLRPLSSLGSRSRSTSTPAARCVPCRQLAVCRAGSALCDVLDGQSVSGAHRPTDGVQRFRVSFRPPSALPCVCWRRRLHVPRHGRHSDVRRNHPADVRVQDAHRGGRCDAEAPHGPAVLCRRIWVAG